MKKILNSLILLILILSNIFIVNGEESYILTIQDNKIINQLNGKLEKIISSNSIEYNNKIIQSLKKSKNKTQINSKLYTILDSVINNSQIKNQEKNYLNHYKEFKINFDKISNYWLELHNTARKNLNLKLYSYDQRLNNTAYEWSNIQKNKGSMDHKRNIGDSYYDYNIIENWFNVRGINCKIINRTTSSESIGKFGYYCNDEDCSDKVNEAIKVIFDMYMAEKGKSNAYNAHYRAITHKDITKIGLGLSIKETKEKNYYDLYITTHYCTEFIE